MVSGKQWHKRLIIVFTGRHELVFYRETHFDLQGNVIFWPDFFFKACLGVAYRVKKDLLKVLLLPAHRGILFWYAGWPNEPH